MEKQKMKALGKKVTEFMGFDTFPAPEHLSEVVMESDEVTALCPVTGQPDWYTVRITYIPRHRCLESKTLKLYLQQFREHGEFVEQLASRIAQDIYEALDPLSVHVDIVQKPRGGVKIVARADIQRP